MPKDYWEQVQQSSQWDRWASYAFSSVCYKHIHQISNALKLCPTYLTAAWRHVPKDSLEVGAYVDLLFNDYYEGDTIILCEFIYTPEPFVIDQSYAKFLGQKSATFKKHTKSKKHIKLALVVASGLKKNLYSEELVSGVCTLQDLFKKA